jgi:hypothetical protein
VGWRTTLWIRFLRRTSLSFVQLSEAGYENYKINNSSQ